MARVFVVGFPRSGTTIVQAMLARHPAVFTLPETSFFEKAVGDLALRMGDSGARSDARMHHRLGFAHGASRRVIAELARELNIEAFGERIPARLDRRAHRFVELLDAAANARGATTWVEKTPNHLFYLDAIERAVPGARIVHVIRSGEEVLASILDARMKHGDTVFCGPLETWIARWNHAMSIHATYAGQTNHFIVRHDRLVANPGAVWHDLARFAELAPSRLRRPNRSSIARPLGEPWKRGALDGVVRDVPAKVDEVFGPRMQRWLRDRLTPFASDSSAPQTGSRPSESNMAHLGGMMVELADTADLKSAAREGIRVQASVIPIFGSPGS